MRNGIFWLRRIWLPGFYGRLTLLLFILSLFTLYFYIVGNSQGFSDNTLLFLFSVESWILALCTLAGVFSTISYALTLPVNTWKHVKKMIFSAAASVFSVLVYLTMAILQAFMDTYRG